MKRTIKNKNISVSIENNLIISIMFNGTEILNTTKKWAKKFPILFPAIGLNKSFEVFEKKYNIAKHGFWNDLIFAVETTGTKIILTSDANHETYPFDFKIKQIISIDDNKIKISTTIDGETPYQFGYHPAFNYDNGTLKIDSISVNINKDFTIEKDNLSTTNISDLNWEKVDTFITEQKTFELINNKYTLLFSSNMPYTAIWTNGDKYVCIEPWSGLPSLAKPDDDIIKKETFNLEIELKENK